MKTRYAALYIFKSFLTAKKRTYFICMLILICAVLTFSLRTISRASEQHTLVKTYESITIMNDDTLWDIAGKYMCSEYTDQNQLVKEIMKLNHISNKNYIVSGKHLIIPVYR